MRQWRAGVTHGVRPAGRPEGDDGVEAAAVVPQRAAHVLQAHTPQRHRLQVRLLRRTIRVGLTPSLRLLAARRVRREGCAPTTPTRQCACACAALPAGVRASRMRRGRPRTGRSSQTSHWQSAA